MWKSHKGLFLFDFVKGSRFVISCEHASCTICSVFLLFSNTTNEALSEKHRFSCLTINRLPFYI